MNWCGAEGSWFKPPLSIFFHTSCNKHDELYGKWTTVWHKTKADLLLFFYMCKDVNRVGARKRPYYYTWAFIYLIGLTVGGWGAFYKDKK